MAGLRSPGERRLVYVVEPHPIAAFHLATTLKRNPGLEVVLCELSLRGEPSLSSKPSILVLEAGALPFPLVPFLRTARAALGDAPILVIGGRASDDDLCRLLTQGVKGFVNYDEVEQEICAAVDNLLKGHMWFPPQALEQYAVLSPALEKERRAEHGILSPREGEVLGLLQRRLSDPVASSV